MKRDTKERHATAPGVAGLTVLVVEDSRHAADALRLMLRRLGARVRRADCLGQARRHLALYLPNAVVVDLELPDGSGVGLIAELARSATRPRIVAVSGHPECSHDAMVAGADVFLAKPIDTLETLHRALSGVHAAPYGIAPAASGPDPLALRDDLIHACRLLEHPPAVNTDPDAIQRYTTRFLSGVARNAGDEALRIAADSVRGDADIAVLTRTVRARLAAQPLI